MLPTIAEVTGAKAPPDVDGISILPTLIGEAAAGHAQKEHEYLYWEIGKATAIRQGNWRAVRPNTNAPWELYDLAVDPGESQNLTDSNPEIFARLVGLAASAHQPAVEGTFTRTDRHERDRRAKTGQHDQPAAPAPGNKGKAGARAARETFSLPTEGMLPSKEWKVFRASSENTPNKKFAFQAVDGDPGTLWHTKFSGGVAPPPHELVIDLGAEHTVRGFVYLGRQDAGWNGAVKDVEFAISDSPDQFGDPVVKTQLAKTKRPQTIACPPTQGRYVLMRALSEHSGNEFATVAELGIMGE